MDFVDRVILNTIQTDFPIKPRPYLDLSKRLNISENEAHKKINNLRIEGIVRRLGAVFDSRRLGYRSTLCAAKVPLDKINILTELLNHVPGVTHNYLRDHVYNMWFTLIAPTPRDVEKVLSFLRNKSGVIDIFSLPATKVFKIKVDLDLTATDSEGDSEELTESSFTQQVFQNQADSGILERYEVNKEEIALIRILQEDIPYSLTPFHDIAEILNWNYEKVIQMTENFVNKKVIRRFGAVLRHQKAGFVANVMGTWIVDSKRVTEVGNMMAKFKEVSHCYERPTLPDWPYNLFTMIHGRSEEDCKRIINDISQIVGVNNFKMLYSVAELKKSSMRYFLETEE